MDLLVAVTGVMVIAGTLSAAIRTVVVPRGVPVRLTSAVFVASRAVFDVVAGLRRDPQHHDRTMALFAPLTLLVLPLVWAAGVGTGSAMVLWALGVHPVREAVILSGSSLLTLGFARTDDLPTLAVSFGEAFLGLVIVALMISFLPTMYGHFSRREATVATLETRAGSPPSAVTMIERHHMIGWLGRLDTTFVGWETWFSEIEESHTSFSALSFFRSPQPERSWITAAGAMLDTASLAVSCLDWSHPALAPDAGGMARPSVQGQLVIRTGFLSLRHIADVYGIEHDPDPDPSDPVSVTRAEFDGAMDRLAAAGVPLRADRDAAYRDFSGWRVNYDVVLRALCGLIEPPPAPWSSDRALPRPGPRTFRGAGRRAAQP